MSKGDRGMHQHKSHEVLGLGAPIMDLILKVSDEFLATVPGELHGMEPVEYEVQQDIIKRSGHVAVPVPGGSASNMLRGLARFGHPCAVVGTVGTDLKGEGYLTGLKDAGVDGWLFETDTPTSIVLSLVNPQGQRTMRSYFGASNELTAEDLTPELFKGVKILHIEGYAFYNKEPTIRAMELAKEAGVKVSLDLSAFEVVRAFKEEMIEALRNTVDIVFANEDEALEVTGLHGDEACSAMGEMVETNVVMMGRRGCWARRGDSQVYHPAFVVERPVDTTGAGDLFASGFLHGTLDGACLDECCRIACLAGATVVQVLGAVIPSSLWPPLLSELSGERSLSC